MFETSATREGEGGKKGGKHRPGGRKRASKLDFPIHLISAQLYVKQGLDLITFTGDIREETILIKRYIPRTNTESRRTSETKNKTFLTVFSSKVLFSLKEIIVIHCYHNTYRLYITMHIHIGSNGHSKVISLSDQCHRSDDKLTAKLRFDSTKQ